ncbi:MAG: tetratricopeptide repeat protein [Hyphomicrobiaceae bacterium]|nr:MAG: tetratricopeptide repeat protein [Hyphomicrobiaceae bacterium]
MVDQRDVLAREVDEELRREQLLKLWEKYGIFVIAAFALIVIGVGGYKYLEHRAAVAAEAAGARFVAASRDAAQKKTAEAQKTLEDIAANGPPGYATLARLRLAAADQAAGKTAEAAAAYETISTQRGIDLLLSDYARLQAAMLRLDTAGWTDMQNRLIDLVAEENAWRFSARELLGLAAHKAGKAEEARREFQRLLSDRNTPPGIAERARIMMAVLTEADLARAAPATPAPQPAAAPTDEKAKVKPADKKPK